MLGWLAGLSLLVNTAKAEVVDRILYVVGARVVTASDLRFETEFDPFDQSPVAPLDSPAYPIEARLIDFAVLRELASDQSIYRPDARDVRVRYEAVRGNFESNAAFDAFLRRWGMDEVLLQGFLSSRMVVERFVRRNASLEAGGDPEARYQGWVAELRTRVILRALP